MQSVHTPQRMVVAGVGIDHGALVEVCRHHFVVNKKPIWAENPEIVSNAKPADKSVSQYTGGLIVVSYIFPSIYHKIDYTVYIEHVVGFTAVVVLIKPFLYV